MVGFQTKKCDHEKLTMSERKLRVSMHAVLNDLDNDLCSGFQSIRNFEVYQSVPDKSFSENVENNYCMALEVKKDNNCTEKEFTKSSMVILNK